MWSLSSDMHHLNHGSWGAVPVEIQKRQTEWRRRWEANTTAFVMRELPQAMEASRAALAGFLSASPETLAFVRNATTAIASVIRSIEPWFSSGDEIVTTSHDYNAVRQTLEFTADRCGARVVVAPVPFPLDAPEAVTAAVLNAVSHRTRLVVVDHITSPTAVMYPIEAIVAALEPEIPVLVDGAHGPGQIPLDLSGLGASWYAGNLHKWVCAPKGAAFLHTRDDRLRDTFPDVISHGWNLEPEPRKRYRALFDWVGTDDFSSWLVVPDLLELLGGLEPGGWPGLMERNHRLAVEAREVLTTALQCEPPVPEEMMAAMTALILPNASGEDPGGIDSPLTSELIAAGFEALVMIWPHWPGQVLRVSAYHYNTLDEYQALAQVLVDKLSR
ncbi:MAG: aminotransferase class V-fold PLP-dependent enzyme [Acidimicrobiia bacterium]